MIWNLLEKFESQLVARSFVRSFVCLLSRTLNHWMWEVTWPPALEWKLAGGWVGWTGRRKGWSARGGAAEKEIHFGLVVVVVVVWTEGIPRQGCCYFPLNMLRFPMYPSYRFSRRI